MALAKVFDAVAEATGERLGDALAPGALDGQTVGMEQYALLRAKDGSRFSIEQGAAPIRDFNGQIIGSVLVFRDVTRSRDLARQLTWAASHDELTGLINRREFEHRLAGLLETARVEHKQHAVLYLDLDQFKVVNDTSGHTAGDELLRQLTATLEKKVRESDTLARLGGDEFGVLLEGCPLERAAVIADALRAAITEFRFVWQDKVFENGVSIGVVAITEHSESTASIMSAADSACYVAKDQGRNRVHVSHADDSELSLRQGEMQWVQRISRALDEDRLRLYYQTIQTIAPLFPEPCTENGVSIGVVAITEHSESTASIMSAADSACYVAKDQGRNRVHVSHADDSELSLRQGEMQWVQRISRALDEDRLRLYYQTIQTIAPLFPEPCTVDGDCLPEEHYEVLLRMVDESGKVVPPMAFIPAAERYNMMPAIDRWVIRTVLNHLATHGTSLGSTCSINLSGQSLGDDQMLDFIVAQLDSSGVAPECICFEITETAAIANLTRATRFMQVLKGMGCRFSLDDFGSGMSSFGYLKHLRVDYLKIDGSFVRDMVEDEVDHAMVEAINRIGHVMGIRTIAEFVENDAILDKLRAMGVDFAQGYGIHKPEPLTHTAA
jgi:diguanylate cyclase (GGDEF)-like protein